MRITYDVEGDAAYIYLTDTVTEPETVRVDDDINLDFDAGGRLVGIEVLAASERLDLSHLESLVETFQSRPVSWNRLKKELLRRKQLGEPIKTLKQGVKNWVKEVGDDYVILASEHPRAVSVRRITRELLENSNLDEHKKHRRKAIVQTLWSIGGYK